MRYPSLGSAGNVVSWAQRLIVQLERDFFSPGRGEITLTANATTTTLTDAHIGPTRKVLLIPKTANAAAIANTVYIGTIADATATITHASDANTDKTFHYVVI